MLALFTRERVYADPPIVSSLNRAVATPQQCLYFFPLPQGHGSFRPIFPPWGGGDFAVDQGKNVEFDTLPFQRAQYLHNVGMASPAIRKSAIAVMNFSGAIHANADQELGLLQIAGKLVVNQYAVGLETVGNDRSRLPVLSLQFRDQL